MFRFFIMLMIIVLVGSGVLVGQNMDRLERKLQSMLVKISGKKAENVIPSIFIKLKTTEFDVPVSRSGNGGGLTSVSDHILLITHEGSFFVRSVNGGLLKFDLEPPKSGFAEYRKVSESSDYGTYEHNLDSFRFNDVIYYDTGDERGLAVSYTEFNKTDICYTNTLAKLVFKNGEENSPHNIKGETKNWQLVYRSKPCLPFKDKYRAIEGHMAGGRMVF
jgi:hypothetical protein